MRTFHIAVSFVAAFVPAALPGWAQCSAPNAGYTWISVPEPNATPPFQNGVMNVGIWYPTSAQASSYEYNAGSSSTGDNPPTYGDVAFVAGNSTTNSQVSTCAKYPVLLFSHGDGGCGTQSVFLTEQAARMGYIVIAPDSVDATCSVTGVPYTDPDTIPLSLFLPSEAASWTPQTEINRLHDIENALLAVYGNASYGPSMDLTHIAVSGHSTGGYTAFGIVGGWSTWLSDWQTLMASAGISEATVKAALLLSPVITPYTYQTPSTVPQVKVPLMFQGGTSDSGITPWVMGVGLDNHDIGAFAEANGPKLFMELYQPGENSLSAHLDFSNKVCTSDPVQPPTVQSCLADVPKAALIDNYAFAFLSYYLLNDPQGGSLLWSVPTPLVQDSTDQGPANWWRITPATSLSDASFSTAAPLASDEIAAMFGTGLAISSATAPSGEAPVALGKVLVSVTDSANVTRPAPLYYVSTAQVNYIVPGSTASGTATVTASDTSGAVTNSADAPFPGNPAVQGDIVATGTINVTAVSPGIFTLNTSSLAAADVDYVSGALQTIVGDFQVAAGTYMPGSIDLSLGPSGTILELFGTGIRNASQSAVSVTFNGIPGTVLYSGPNGGGYAGLDQVNVQIPNNPAVQGNVLVQLTAGGVQANPVYISVM